MKIAQAVVEMNSSHEYSGECEVNYTQEGSFRTVFEQVSGVAALPESKNTEGKERLLLMLENLITRMLELIPGQREIEVADLRELPKAQDFRASADALARPRRQIEMELSCKMTERIHEQESTWFVSTGKIETADGRALDFKLDLAMNRDYACEREIADKRKVVLRDPLVINFDGQATELSGKRFAFDLDADGSAESIAELGRCSGYLAIDRNADGCINDGSELFGTRSGDGFADLAKLDSDGNRWLDENDPAFNSLRVWRPSVPGGGRLGDLASLRDAGVGALYLGSTETSFALTDEENKPLAYIRSTSVYLAESGKAGSVQQIDFAI